MLGGVGVRAAAGPVQAAHERHPPVHLVPGEDAAGDQVPGLGGDPLVVVADAGQAVLCRPVPGDVHHRGAVAQAAELVRGGEGGAGERGLIAERPVQLGGVADRLVNGEPQVAGVDDQVVAAGLDAGRGEFLRQQAGQGGQFGGEVPGARRARRAPRAAAQVLQAPPGRGRERAHGLEPSVRLDRDAVEPRGEPDPLLEGRGVAVAVELALTDLEQRGVHVGDPLVCEQSRAPLSQQVHLVGQARLERVYLVGRHPAHIAVRGLVSELDPF